MQNDRDDEYVGGMKVRSEDVGFRADEMIECPKCAKPNAPTRANCFYCAQPISAAVHSGEFLKLNLRQLENWENGFNVVAAGPAAVKEGVSGLFGRPIDGLLTFDSFAPLARLESAEDAAAAKTYLEGIGLNVYVVSDVALKSGRPNIRVRSMTFLEDSIAAIPFNAGEAMTLTQDDIALVVSGRITESRSETFEKGRKKAARKVVDETLASNEMFVLDIYGRDDEQGWRVLSKGFDFSCLGGDKTMIVEENFTLLNERINRFAPKAKFDDSYNKLSDELSAVWDLERHRDSEGLKRTGLWQSRYASVVRTSNMEQFSRYSRLQRILL